MLQKIEKAVSYIKNHYDQTPSVGIILGSGLGIFQERVELEASFDYEDIPGFPVSTALGHAGKLLLGTVKGKKVVVMSGRFHYYEGYSMEEIVFPVRVMAKLGVTKLLITNAAGGINKSFQVGDLMLIEDHINFLGTSPLRGQESKKLGERFVDMSTTYTPSLRKIGKAVGKEMNIVIREGVYVATHGPNYETPAEIRMMRIVGGDAVGMSTVPEVIAARQLNMEIMGISCITNMAAGVTDQPLSGEEVIEAANESKDKIVEFFERVIAKM